MQNTDICHLNLPTVTGQPCQWENPQGLSKGLMLATALSRANCPLLVVVSDNLAVSELMDELAFFLGEKHQIVYFPDWETLPYDHFSPHQDIISERLEALERILQLKEGIILTTVTNLMQRLAPKRYLDAHRFVLKTGDKLDVAQLRTRLAGAGYHAVSQVREHGEFAIRGSIIDIFPMGAKTPFRIDLLDDEVDSIRTFSQETQRSLDKIPAINLLPAKEFPLTDEAIEHFRQSWRKHFTGNPLKAPIYQDITEGILAPGIEYYFPLFFEQTATLFDYLPENTFIVTIGDIENKAIEFAQEIETRYVDMRHDITRPLLPPAELFLSLPFIQNALQHYRLARMAPPILHSSLPVDIKQIKQFADSYAGRILFCAETMGRREVMLQLLKGIGLTPTYVESWQTFLNSDVSRGITVSPIEHSFTLNNPPLTLLTETQLYGKRIMQRRLRKKTPQDTEALIRDLSELQLNDAVVHIDHGVGRYRGLQTLTVGDQVAEFLCLEYQDEAKLYVPVSSLHLISRYAGSDPEQAPLNRLGTEQWQRAKRKAAEKVRDVAAELLELYASRAARAGHTYELQQDQYAAFSASFPFEETADQLQAIEQVFADMTSSKPMDRVICGDVGFGKTEVALRAAYLAVQNNKQVAMLVPTTLLAQQHFATFQNRFANWPIQVELLSRFRTGKEQKNVLARLKAGNVDIVIGTHKLLQSDIEFRDLGLLIVDEEHRFGVKQKEKLKSLRANVDILTLTATPIPRTLNMALSGIRDLSVIATPPARRLSVKTFVHEYQPSLIHEAMLREIMRGGQVYFLHNEVSTIHKQAEELSALIPEARVAVAHGQMHERELERIMSDFYHRRYNVLVCSTIIESGIDIPTANTILINRADKFGIAQLHQLRGRVGRSHHQAYAYLIIPPRNQITADALKRLDAITQFDDLGIGFTLATHDLEIRGTGELLGEGQSGDMQEVGFTLYMELLSRAVDALKQGKEPDLEKSLLQHRSEIDLHLSALIPESYLADVQLRLQFYKRIANAKNQQELDDIQIEMIDRFGLLPPPLKNLIAITELKLKADAIGITKIEATEKGGKFEFTDTPHIKPETIIRLIQTEPQRFRLDGPTKLRFTLKPHSKEERIELVTQLLELVCR